ncbi:MAG: DNA repair protein RecO [Bacteroidetes bacterium]|nr:DNA repair protein RecO [Bacteroidota bacterium]
MIRLFKTRGIVLHQIKYGETSLIVKIYTELFGLQTYLFKGVRGKSSKIKPNILQHGSLVDMVVYHKEKSSIQHVKEIKSALNYQSIPFDIRKSSISLFINELLYKTIYEEESNPALFNFIFETFRFLDVTDRPVANFHLFFAVQLTRYLGFFPQAQNKASENYFDLKEGHFSAYRPVHDNIIPPQLSASFSHLMSAGYEEISCLRLTSEDRMILLDKIIEYYRLHILAFGEIRSHLVLREVLK